jgi:hypothetical protein
MILDIRSKVDQLIKQGKSEQEIVAAHPTSAYDAKLAGALNPILTGGNSADRFVRMLYAQLKN